MKENLVGQKFGKLTVIEIVLSTNKKWKRTYFKCICDCGNQKITNRNQLKSGFTKSCGCLHKKYHPQETSARGIYKNYFDCDFEVFLNYSQLNCHYCGIEPIKISNCFKRWETNSFNIGNFKYNGLDRINNNEKHITNNIVPCCYYCNSAKQTKPYYEFIIWLKLPYFYKLIINNDFILNKKQLRPAKRIWNSTYKQIPFEIFLKLSQSPCYYCGLKNQNKVKNERTSNIYFEYNGLDRVNNNLDHSVIENLVPACKWCNWAKNDRTIMEFKKWKINCLNNIEKSNLEFISIDDIINKYKKNLKTKITFPIEVNL